MLRLAALPLAFLCLTGAAAAQPRLTLEGLGPVRIGMNEIELQKQGFSDPDSKKRVTDFRAGLAGPVGYIEGCS